MLCVRARELGADAPDQRRPGEGNAHPDSLDLFYDNAVFLRSLEGMSCCCTIKETE